MNGIELKFLFIIKWIMYQKNNRIFYECQLPIYNLRSLFYLLMCQISILLTKTILFVLDSV